jgi:hypothetical protein
LFKKINNIDKPLAKVTKRRKERTQINKIGGENGILQQIPAKFRRSLGNVLKTYTPTNWKIKKKMDKFLDMSDPSNLN